MSNRVVWREGMSLSPHHFQQSEIFQDYQARVRWQLFSPFFYGFSKLDVETESLDLGIFSIRSCSGIMPDSSHFSFPQTDSELESRSFESLFSLEKENLGVYLGLPSLSHGSPNLEKRPDSDTRYAETTREVADLNSGSNTRPMEFSRLNLRLLFEGEVLEGYHTLKAGELSKDAHGKVILNPAFIPPLLNISGSEVLLRHLKKLIDLCSAKSNYLMAERPQKASGMPFYSPETLNQYLLLSAINRSLPDLLHMYQTPHAHPEMLFMRLLSLYGGLISFSEKESVTGIPPYSHQDPTRCFTPLFALIEDVLNKTMIMDYINVPLVKTSPIQSAANFKSINLGAVSQLYLAATAQAPEIEIINSIRRILKTGPMSQIHKLVDAAIPGIELIPEAHPPATIPVKAGYKYFRFILQGNLWHQILHEKSLAIHMPTSLPGLKVELLALGSNLK